MVGEGNFVEVVVRVVHVECRKAAIGALHACEPVERPVHGVRVAAAIHRALHRPDDDRSVIKVGVMAVAALKGPAAARDARPVLAPVTRGLQELARQ